MEEVLEGALQALDIGDRGGESAAARRDDDGADDDGNGNSGAPTVRRTRAHCFCC